MSNTILLRDNQFVLSPSRSIGLDLGILKKAVIKGTLALLALLSVYFLALTLISGWIYTWGQFTQFWYYILNLAGGFGIQFGLYTYLKEVLKKRSSAGPVLATTGVTSTAAMVSCCTHYLINILPILGVTGIVSLISQYQPQIFLVGIFFNLLGIIYIGNKVFHFSKSQ